MAVISFLLWLIAKLVAGIYGLTTGVEPTHPSQLDIIWVLGCVFSILGLWSYTSNFTILLSEAADRLKHLVLLIPLATFFAVTTASLAAVNPLKLISVVPLRATLDIAYTVLDSILLSLAILNLFLFRRGILGRV